MKYFLFENGVHEYTCEVDEIKGSQENPNPGTQYALRASMNGEWSEHIKGEILSCLIDSGNGVKFFSNELHFKNENQYHDVEYLRILLNLKNKIDHAEQMEYLMVKEDSQVTI